MGSELEGPTIHPEDALEKPDSAGLSLSKPGFVPSTGSGRRILGFAMEHWGL
jgi:hypothetical protein